MKALAIAALAATVILSGSPALAQTPLDTGSGAVAEAPVPAGTLEYDTFHATAVETILAYGRNWDRLIDCKAWACYSTYFLRIDTILTTGIKWMLWVSTNDAESSPRMVQRRISSAEHSGALLR